MYSDFIAQLYPKQLQELSEHPGEIHITCLTGLPGAGMEDVLWYYLSHNKRKFIQIKWSSDVDEFELQLLRQLAEFNHEIADVTLFPDRMEHPAIPIFVTGLNNKEIDAFEFFLQKRLTELHKIHIYVACPGCSVTFIKANIRIKEIHLQAIESKDLILSYFEHCLYSSGQITKVKDDLPWDGFCGHPVFISHCANLLASGKFLWADLQSGNLFFLYQELFAFWFRSHWETLLPADQQLLLLLIAVEEPFPSEALRNYPNERKNLLAARVLQIYQSELISIPSAVVCVLKNSPFYDHYAANYSMAEIFASVHSDCRNSIQTNLCAYRCYLKCNKHEKALLVLKKSAQQAIEYKETISDMLSYLNRELPCFTGVDRPEWISLLVRLALCAGELTLANTYLPEMTEGTDKIICLAEKHCLNSEFEKALNLYEKISLNDDISFMLSTKKVSILSHMGKRESGLNILNGIKERLDISTDLLQIGKWHLARVFIGDGILPKEELFYELKTARYFFRQIGARYYQALCLNKEAFILWAENYTDEVLRISEVCLSFFEQTNDMKSVALNLVFRADIFINIQKYDKAQNDLKKAIAICNRYGYNDALSLCHQIMADLSYLNGDTQNTGSHYQIALDYTSESGSPILRACQYYYRGIHFLRKKFFDEAFRDFDFLESFAFDASNLRLLTMAYYGKMKLTQLCPEYHSNTDYSLLFVKTMYKLPEYVQKSLNRRIAFFEDKYFNLNEDSFLMVRYSGTSIIDSFEIQPSLEAVFADFDIFCNFVTSTLKIREQEIKFFHLDKLASVLKVIVNRYPKAVSTKEIFEQIWNKPYKPYEDSVIRTNICRLRKIFHSHLKDELIYSPSRGIYTLNNKIHFCFILPYSPRPLCL